MTANIGEQELNEIFGYLLGLPIKEAIGMIGHSYTIRPLRKDGMELGADTFFKDNRINVEITEGHISRILSIG